MKKSRAVFFDRDGTLVDAIVRPDFSKKVTAPFTLEELRFSEKALFVLNTLRGRGFRVIMITNQPDVAYEYLTKEKWEQIQATIVEVLGFQSDEVFMCRHRTEDRCECKKPFPVLIQYAACLHDIDLSTSYMVGDSEKDMEVGIAAGCKTVLIRRPYNSSLIRWDFTIKQLTGLLRIVE